MSSNSLKDLEDWLKENDLYQDLYGKFVNSKLTLKDLENINFVNKESQVFNDICKEININGILYIRLKSAIIQTFSKCDTSNNNNEPDSDNNPILIDDNSNDDSQNNGIVCPSITEPVSDDVEFIKETRPEKKKHVQCKKYV